MKWTKFMSVLQTYVLTARDNKKVTLLISYERYTVDDAQQSIK